MTTKPEQPVRKRPPFWMALSLLAFCAFALPSGKAFAQCETPWNAANEFNDLASDIVDELNDFIDQEENFITELVTHRAKYEMLNRLYEFDYNIRVALTNWWWNSSGDCFLCALKHMTMQLSASQADQSRMIGTLLDAQMQNEFTNAVNQAQVEAFRRYQPNENSCLVDSLAAPATGGGPQKAIKMSRALARASALEAQPRASNAAGSPSELGAGAEHKWLWDDYVAKWCDPAVGDQGCAVAGNPVTAHQHTNIPGLLWGDKQTFDMQNADTRDIIEAAQRYFIQLKSMDPVPAQSVNAAAGQESILDRRSQRARMNTIYNVVGQLFAERAGGSGINTQDVRVAAGLPPGDAATDASYRELMQAMTMDRHRDPQWVVRMVNEPELVVKEQGSINAIKMQQMNDIYKRWEELLFMAAAGYANNLDADMPHDSDDASPTR